MTEFAWGVAHQFSNLVQVILGFAQLIRSQYPGDPELLDEVQEIITASGRARGVVEQLLIISRRRELVLKPVDLNGLLQRMAAPMTEQAGGRVSIEVRSAPAPLLATADASSLERLLLQLAASARTAMPDGGTLVLTAGPAADGRMIRLSIRDSGAGYDAEAASRMFEPFFLKRRFGYGDGLELAVASHLMLQHGGSIEAETAPGQGTALHLLLPRTTTEHGRG